MQGVYVFAPSGLLLGRLNSNRAEPNFRLLTDALSKWQELGGEEKRLDDASVVAARFRWEQSYPHKGLVLMRTARDLPASLDPTAKKAARYNRDSLWFSKEEARAWLPERLELGAKRSCGRSGGDTAARVIGMRLAQLSLVDNARGQTLPYHADEIEGLRFETTVTALRDDLVDVEFEVDTLARAKGPWLWGDNYWRPKQRQEQARSIVTRMIGTASYDKTKERFVRFEALALGRYRGKTTMNGRGRGPSSGAIGFVLRLAPSTWRVAPTFVNVYGVPWIKASRAAAK